MKTKNRINRKERKNNSATFAHLLRTLRLKEQGLNCKERKDFTQRTQRKLCDFCTSFANSAVKRTIVKPQRALRFYAKNAKKTLRPLRILCELCG